MDEVENPNLIKLKISYFIASHKVFFKRLAIFVSVLVCLGLYGYSTYHFTDYFLKKEEYERMLRLLAQTSVNFQDYRIRHQPQALVVLNEATLPGLGGKYDFAALVGNPNREWLAERVTYRFVWPDGVSKTAEDIVLPSDETYLLILNSEVSSQPQQAGIEFVDIGWRRVRKSLGIQKSDFIISDEKFISPLDAKVRDSKDVPARVTFTVRNNTFYNFWEAGFKVTLLRGNAVIAVHYSSASQFRSGTTITQEVIWLEPISVPTDIVIEPAVDFLHSENFMPRESSGGELK